jgi:hypothetical protein
LQQWSAAAHFGHWPVNDIPGGSVVAQLKQREAVTA